MKYEVYYLEGLEDKTIWNKLTGMLFAFSDTFSLITFKYYHNEKASPTTTKILKEVSRYRIGSRIVKKWPSTEILGDQKHIYRMNLFRIDLNGIDKLFSVFEQVGTLWDWDYPDYPMDPCFYKNGYAWFSVSTHEHECQVFLEKGGILQKSDIESIGATLIPMGEIDQCQLFRLDDDWTAIHEKTQTGKTKKTRTDTADIDSIMEMLSCDKAPEIQEEGRRLAGRVKSISVFLKPENSDYNKELWYNCAQVLSERSDRELQPYLFELFRWVNDMNGSGAECIFNRLRQYRRDECFDSTLQECVNLAKYLENDIWLETLLRLEKER